jgi:hypothetical protein
MHGAPDVYHKVVPYMAGFLFVWWIPGAGVTTFSGPFLSVGNGYFGAWGAFLSAFLLCHARYVCQARLAQIMKGRLTI